MLRLMLVRFAICSYVLAYIRCWRLALAITSVLPVMAILGGAAGYFVSKVRDSFRHSVHSSGLLTLLQLASSPPVLDSELGAQGRLRHSRRGSSLDRPNGQVVQHGAEVWSAVRGACAGEQADRVQSRARDGGCDGRNV